MGEEAPASIVSGSVYVDENADRAEERAHQWLGGYWRSVIAHYEFDRPHLKATPGYEFHGQMHDLLNQPNGMEKTAEFFVGLQPWGTPEQVYEKIKFFCDLAVADSFIAGFRYGGMPPEEAERGMPPFAKEVMPELEKIPSVEERLHLVRETR